MVDHVPKIELIPTRAANGAIVLRADVVGPKERLRRLLRRLMRPR
jgi:hypothetical protein